MRQEPVMKKNITHVGLDVHQETIVAAVLLPRRRESEIVKLPNDSAAVCRFVRKVKARAPGAIEACYEAGPTGFHLQRLLQQQGIGCSVIAPSLIPAKPGDRVKTDRRDAEKLAKLLRGELLTEVHPPNEADEAVRDLCRAREAAKQDSTAAKHRLTKFLLRRGQRCTAKAWGSVWWTWLRKLKLEQEADRIILESYVMAVETAEERVTALDAHIKRFSEAEPYKKDVAGLRCFRGIDTVTAMTVVSELHGFERFTNPRQLMGYLGLAPSEYSSGNRTVRGGITKAGNAHVRRVLIEAAWHYRHRPGVGHQLKKRREGQSIATIATADKAMRRLYKKWTSMVYRGVPTPKATTAVARELVGFIWASMMGTRLA
jgi:transposase